MDPLLQVILGLLGVLLQVLELLPQLVLRLRLDPLDDEHLLLQVVHRRVGALARLADDGVRVRVLALKVLEGSQLVAELAMLTVMTSIVPELWCILKTYKHWLGFRSNLIDHLECFFHRLAEPRFLSSSKHKSQLFS